MKASFLALIFIYSMLNATIIDIPADQLTIQAGIDESVDGDTVLVQTGTYYENINFNGKNIILASLFLTTQDTGYISQTIIDGNQNGNVVRFENYEDSTSVLVGFTIANGFAQNGNGYNSGGGIYGYRSNPKLMSLVIANNSAGLNGGGIFFYWSYPIIENVTIMNNTAGYGGGVNFYLSDPKLYNIIIEDNVATGHGGGLAIDSSFPILTDVMISNNSASTSGGGINSTMSSLTFENVTIANNSAVTRGGGFYLWLSEQNFSSLTITDNVAGISGGGIYFNESDIIFESENRTSIYNNSVINRGYGSDIYSFQNDPINVIVDTFTVMNPTNFHASPIENYSFDILHSTQTQTNSDLYVSPDGDNSNTGLNPKEPLKTIQYACSIISGDSLNSVTVHLLNGLYSHSSSGEVFPISLSEFINLIGESEDNVILDAENYSSVLRFSNTENVSITNLTITNGLASEGGGIYIENSNPNIQNLTIISNTANWGGGIFIEESNPILMNVTISNNSALYQGGGIRCDTANPSFENVTIMNNTARSGGGISFSVSSPFLKNLLIENNTAIERGGGIYCYQNSNPILENAEIINNSADFGGGGIYCVDSNPSFMKARFVSNSAEHSGGAIYCDDSDPSFTNTNIINNYTESSGGGIYCFQSAPKFERVTISNNLAEVAGGGIYCKSNSKAILINSILWNNIPDGVTFCGILYSNTITIAYSDIEDGLDAIITNNNGIVNWLEGNLNVDPSFVNAENGDYQLLSDSPCIDAGIGYFEFENEVLVDLNEFDYYGIFPDIGTYEYEEFSAQFHTDDIAGYIPYEVQFTDFSYCNPTEWEWDFNNDGIVDSFDQNPHFVYTESGMYSVSLTISNGSDTVAETKINYIMVAESITADFVADSTEGILPFESQFTDLSFGGLPPPVRQPGNKGNSKKKRSINCRDIVSWEWDFDNDGIVDSYEENPIYIYSNIGTFSVSLTISDGFTSVSETKTDYISVNVPLKNALLQNHPNPFNPTTNIKYELHESGFVEIDIYNIKGQFIKSLVAQMKDVGKHVVEWTGLDENGNEVGTGTYFYKFDVSGKTVETKKMILLK